MADSGSVLAEDPQCEQWDQRSPLLLVAHVSVEDAVERTIEKGWGAHLVKVDICNAYQVLPIHPDDRWLLGMRWEDALFVDTELPFGLRSSPKIFTGVVDALEWIAK